MRSKPPLVWFAAVVFVAIVLGVFFRLYHLDRKVVWSDEIFTQLHVVGLTEGDVVARARRFDDVRSLQGYVSSGMDRPSRPSGATLDSLIAEDPQHAPLYFLLQRTWLGILGDTVLHERLLSAIIGILALPCAYWLAIELFGSLSCAWAFAALMAISPYFVLYSQENREYALWSLAILVLSASALRAIRTMTPSAWIAYACAIAFAAYTDPLSLAVVAGHALYFGVCERERLGRSPLMPGLAIVAGIALFAPWLIVMSGARAQIAYGLASTVSRRDPLVTTLRTFLGEFHLATIDFNIVSRTSVAGFAISLTALAIVCAAFVVVRRCANPRAWGFISCVVVASLVPILGADIASSGHRSSNPRYLVPLFECIELALAFAVTRGIVRDARWGVGFAAIALAGVVSCAESAQAWTWWSKYNEDSIALAGVINSTARPIVVSDNYVHFVLSLAPYLRPGTRLALEPRCFLCHAAAQSDGATRLSDRIAAGDDVFLIGPSQELRHSIHARTSIRVDHVRCIDVERNCASDLRLF